MLTTEVQEKIIGALLKRPENQYCSDCNGKSPCWASLDFGVFVCMNCSGAHRALGPSITRVKSTKLDTWNKDWVENMKIGNSILNQYWEKQLSSMPSNVKPNVNSSLTEIKKYVFDKYVKRKYADSSQDFDPLTKLKKGISITKPQKQQQPVKQVPIAKQVVKQPETVKQVPKHYNKHAYNTVKETTLPFNKEDIFRKLKANEPVQSNPSKPSNDFNLIDFHQNEPVNQQNNNQEAKNVHQVHNDPKTKEITFDTFMQKLSNKSESSSAKGHFQQPLHGNYFMSPQGFANNTPQTHYGHHGYSQPHQQLHHIPQQPQIIPQQPQVTMNINMNMYPNVMNINMGTCPPQMAQIPSHTVQHPPAIHHSATVKQFEFNDFWTGNITPPPQQSKPVNNGITLEVTMKGDEKKGEKSWIEDWM